MGSAAGSRLLFVDDEVRLLRYVSERLEPLGYDVATCRSWEEAQESLNPRPAIIFVEPQAGSNSANGNLLTQMREAVKDVPIVVLSSAREPECIVEALRKGASDYVCKPFTARDLESVIEQTLSGQNGTAQTSVSLRKATKVEFIHSHPKMEHIARIARQIQDTRVPVLITGESGVGKDIIARLFHQESLLGDRQFVKVPCAAIPSELIESELFGHKKGSFTGAHIDRAGKFEVARGGTIFLDEISEMSAGVQAKFLNVLQDGVFSPVGCNDEIKSDVRVIAATNRNLEEDIVDGSFREDLYYRLNVVRVEIPPLRERREDILPLTEFFLEKYARQYGREQTELSDELRDLFAKYRWPGNVRELENLVKRYIVLEDEDSLRQVLTAPQNGHRTAEGAEQEFDQFLALQDGDSWDLKAVRKQAVAAVERRMIDRALGKTGWNKWKAAKELKVSYKTLLVKIEEYGLKRRSEGD